MSVMGTATMVKVGDYVHKNGPDGQSHIKPTTMARYKNSNAKLRSTYYIIGLSAGDPSTFGALCILPNGETGGSDSAS